jgi:CheY-like chemotaxis protein
MPHHILVVDDSATIRKSVDITFAHEDFELTTVSDGPSALEALSEKTPDLALVDANLGPENGVDLAKKMLAMAGENSFPLVLLSSGQQPLDSAALEDAGVTSQLTKPFHTQDLIDHVKTQLGLEVVKSVAAMRFVPRAAKPEPVAPQPGVTAPLPAIDPPPALIKGPPPPAIKGPPPPAPGSPARIQLGSAPIPLAVTPSPFTAPAPASALITSPPAQEPPPPALITPAPEEAETPAPALITEPPVSEDLAATQFEDMVPAVDPSPIITEPIAATVMDLAPDNTHLAPLEPDFVPPPLEVPELAPIPVPEAPTMVMRSLSHDVEDEPYKPEPTHSVPALTSPITDLGLGIDLGAIAEGVSAGSGKISVADGEVDLDALMPVIEAAVRKVTQEVVERVVWEVVPDLAERLIREHLNNR